MNVQPLRLVIHRAHAVGLHDAVFLGEILFGERLPIPLVSYASWWRNSWGWESVVWDGGAEGDAEILTVSL
jgi:hypothetical protein